MKLGETVDEFITWSDTMSEKFSLWVKASRNSMRVHARPHCEDMKFITFRYILQKFSRSWSKFGMILVLVSRQCEGINVLKFSKNVVNSCKNQDKKHSTNTDSTRMKKFSRTEQNIRNIGVIGNTSNTIKTDGICLMVPYVLSCLKWNTFASFGTGSTVVCISVISKSTTSTSFLALSNCCSSYFAKRSASLN